MAWLGYNLTRKTIVQAALVYGKLPRQISFAGAVQAIAASWMYLATASSSKLAEMAAAQFEIIAGRRVGDRPNRVEPRAVKRRAKPHKLLTKPRDEARQELLAGRTRR